MDISMYWCNFLLLSSLLSGAYYIQSRNKRILVPQPLQCKDQHMFETDSEDVPELRRWNLTSSSKATCTIFILLLPDSDVLHLCNKSSSKSKWLLKMGKMLLKTGSSVSFWCHPLKLWSSIQYRSSKIPVPHLIRRNSINRISEIISIVSAITTSAAETGHVHVSLTVVCEKQSHQVASGFLFFQVLNSINSQLKKNKN